MQRLIRFQEIKIGNIRKPIFQGYERICHCKGRNFSFGIEEKRGNKLIENGSRKWNNYSMMKMMVNFEKQSRFYSINQEEKNIKREEKSENQGKNTNDRKFNSLFWIPVGGIITLGLGTWIYSNFVEKEEESSKKKSFWKTLPMVVKIFLFGSGIAIFGLFNAFTIPFILPALKKYGGVPFIPSLTARVESLFYLLPIKKLQGTQLIDLGSGDGRIAIEAARRGLTAVGYELNPWLVWRSQKAAKSAGVDDCVQFIKGDFWKADLSKCSIVTLYGITGIMERASEKLQETMPGTYIISMVYKLPPPWTPIDTQNDVYLYVKADVPKKKELGNEQSIEKGINPS